MADTNAVEDHYSQGQLLARIEAGVRAAGKTPESVTIDDLAPVEEFHIGGRQATQDFIEQLDLSAEQHVLDVGCGIGGTSRFAASTCGCRVSGIDLTGEFIEAGQALCRWVDLDDKVNLRQGSALETGFAAGSFDAAFMLHVGMNIADKISLFAEVARVLKPGGVFGVYDIMRTNDEPMQYPVPWATVVDTSALATPQEYRDALTAAGFEITAERDRKDFATEFFDTLRKKSEAAEGPPPLGLHIVMGETTPIKVRNMVENVAAGRVSPVEMIARKTN